jgi:hypothetical protein
MGFIADDICQELSNAVNATDELIDWRQRYEGVLMVAYLDGKAVAGISGPWPVDKWALTWWDRPVPSRQLELFDSLAAAQARVEEWAWRMRTVGIIDRPPANDPIQPETSPALRAPARPSWLVRLRELMSGSDTPRPQPMPRREIEALRNPPLNDDDLRGIHFAAIE